MESKLCEFKIRIMSQQSVSAIYFHLLVQVLTISVSLETGLKLGECARVVAQSEDTLF